MNLKIFKKCLGEEGQKWNEKSSLLIYRVSGKIFTKFNFREPAF